MAADNREYPAFFIRPDGVMIAITSLTKMYMISPSGSNSGNQGVCIDHYITRKQVLRHYGTGEKVDMNTWRIRYNNVFNRYLDHIINR